MRTVLFTDLDSPYGLPHFFELLGTPGCALVAVVVGHGAAITGGQMRVPDRWGCAVSRDLLKAAADAAIPVLTPARLNGTAFVSGLGRLAPDLLVSAGFRRILPRAVLNVAGMAAVNLHPSPLPRVRGRNPWFWTIATGETETAVTLHHMTREVDAGDIVFRVPVAIDAADTASSLRHKTTVDSLRLIAPLIAGAAAGTLPRSAQDAATGDIFGEPSDRDRTIDWSRSAAHVDRAVRASLLAPGAVTRFRNRVLRVLDADLGSDPDLWHAPAAPGTVLKATANGVAVKAGDGHVVLRRLELDAHALPAPLVLGVCGGEAARDRFC